MKVIMRNMANFERHGLLNRNGKIPDCFLFGTDKELADFQCSESECGESGGDKPEAHDNLRLTPAQQMKMMMDRCAQEQAFSFCVFEICNLQNYAG